MRLTTLIRRYALAMLSIGSCVCTYAADAKFPTKAVRMIVAYTPGSAPDIVARTLAEPLARAWGQPVIVENKLGADGVIANDAAAKAPADGHTLYLATMGNLALAPATIAKLPYDARRAFSGVTFVASNPFALLLGSDIPARTIDEAIKYSQSKGGLRYGSAGTLGPLVGASINKHTGAGLVYVPYKGAQPALIDLIGGHIDMVIADLPSLLPYHKQGKARLLAVTTGTRSSLAPDIPTAAEAGYKDLDFSTWYAIAAPRATPRSTISKINKDAAEILRNPEVMRQLNQLGLAPASSTPEEMDRIIARDIDKWTQLVNETK